MPRLHGGRGPLATGCDAHRRVALGRAAATKALACSHPLFSVGSVGASFAAGHYLQKSRTQLLAVPLVPAFARSREPSIHLRCEGRQEQKEPEHTKPGVQRNT
ncbi:hypothetical protein LIA77_09519 [Sarocladium implicatum]|nr:hypothetical protein LIA77_09519 [Sarocladium implicatum]